MKIDPKATQNHEKLTLEAWEIQFLQKLIFAIPSLPNAWFSDPRHPDSDPKIIRKSNLEINVKRIMFFGPNVFKNLYMWVPKLTKNR